MRFTKMQNLKRPDRWDIVDENLEMFLFCVTLAVANEWLAKLNKTKD